MIKLIPKRRSFRRPSHAIDRWKASQFSSATAFYMKSHVIGKMSKQGFCRGGRHSLKKIWKADSDRAELKCLAITGRLRQPSGVGTNLAEFSLTERHPLRAWPHGPNAHRFAEREYLGSRGEIFVCFYSVSRNLFGCFDDKCMHIDAGTRSPSKISDL